MSFINNALSGAVAAQTALTATSQNIANLQTKGYTRQGALLTAAAPGISSKAPGMGVEVSGLMRFSDSYKTQQMWRAASEQGQYSQSQPYLSQLERVMGDDQSSLSSGIDEFFKALNAAGVEPNSTPLRQQVVTAANSMSQHFNSIYNVVANQELSVNQQRGAMLPALNADLANIARLNQRIIGAQAVGTNVSTLIDERDLALDALASKVAIEVIEQPDGARNVALRTGQPLVVGTQSSSLTFETASGEAVLALSFGGTRFVLEDTKLGGQMGGLSDYVANTLKPLQQSIIDTAEQMSAMINTQLQAGFDAAGNPGGPLFTFDAASTTGMLQINPSFKASDLAFSADGTPGDSANLQALIGIKTRTVNLGSIGPVLLGDADTQLVGKLGIDSQQNQALLKTATTIRQQAEDDWKSTSGVNQDEEAVALMEFQQMYQANMKALAVANSLFDATLAMFN
ncbi:flagellar hook-associated protein FlgK [Pseudoduganella namucuonensis]|uniref:Flagellar hook-associated protein 1 n=1 Tax=Pseudoduganella namucuonensis TaxID=1035707 RepID=A0A1I7HV59_9BURK|nr:flagellar hook-associated protein FlgK [Pseudoduganella namucuonensis]SFU64459.1 flagellar hook-associated protein 1 FlgK [Pseudoduganella namucuonensis]